MVTASYYNIDGTGVKMKPLQLASTIDESIELCLSSFADQGITLLTKAKHFVTFEVTVDSISYKKEDKEKENPIVRKVKARLLLHY
ncbi:hypothetical protein F7Q91_02730 [Vibrio chagasii]|uniref:Uncharacterized protein n=1 Tax=Vibrio chagasii TaxID=170679 RepID=A0A7V7NWW4_9VIBR|nr:hypothetical protein [Vibrio chagasii]KAB0482335.1 hypothetical protein F7Q91_02730 [Vibrio chagasii]